MKGFKKGTEKIMLQDVKAAVIKTKSDATENVLIKKTDTLNMLNYRLSFLNKQMNESSNAEKVKKLQYQNEEVLVIIEKVQGM